MILRDLTISNCTDSAIIVNATSAGKTPLPISVATARNSPPPDLLLRNVAVSNCGGSMGAGVKAVNSRVVVQGCSFKGNTALGCGGAVYADRAALLVLDSKFTGNRGSR